MEDMNTNWSYVELNETTDVIDSIDGDNVGVAAETYSEGENRAQIDNGGEENYPDLVFRYEVGEVVINGNPVEVHPLIAGHHPVARPR